MTAPMHGPSIYDSLDSIAAMVELLRARADVIHALLRRIAEGLSAGGRVLTCGNGGSAAEALHLAEELVGRFQRTRRPLPALCLCADPTALTCIANDFGYDEVFARQVEAHAHNGDMLVALSTSGRSPSIINAVERARQRQVCTIGLLGPSGSPTETLCDMAITLDGVPAARVQEAHLIIIHMLLEHVDQIFASS